MCTWTNSKNTPSCPHWACRVWEQDSFINIITCLNFKKSISPGLQERCRLLVLWQEGKVKENSATHTRANALCGPLKCAAKITGCQAVFTVFSLPGGLSSLGPPRLSSSLLHKYITFLFVPSSTRQLKLVLTAAKSSVCLEYKLWINASQTAVCQEEFQKRNSFCQQVSLVVYLTPNWTVIRATEGRVEAHPET